MHGPLLIGDDSFIEAACHADIINNNYECRCRMRDLRRLLLDERLCSLRRVTFNPKGGARGNNAHDPHRLHHIWTAAVRRRGWKRLDNFSEQMFAAEHEFGQASKCSARCRACQRRERFLIEHVREPMSAPLYSFEIDTVTGGETEASHLHSDLFGVSYDGVCFDSVNFLPSELS